MLPLICPECGAENPSDSERCQDCHALLMDRNEEGQTKAVGDHEESLDLLSGTEHDLPDLLHALRQDEGAPHIEGDQEDLSPEDFVESFSLPDIDESLIDGEIAEPEVQSDELQDEIPDWLLRIRQRTSEEPDSVGEITQKIQAAQESLVEDERADRQDHFSSWLEKLGDDPESAPEVAPIEKPVIDDSEELQPDGEPDWLEKIRLAEGKFDSDGAEDDDENRDGDSLLQWLVSLEDSAQKGPSTSLDEGEKSPLKEETSEEEPGWDEPFFAQEDTQQIRSLEQDTTDQPFLDVSREEQLQADQLAATIGDETAVRSIKTHRRARPSWFLQLGLALVLMVVLGVALFYGTPIDSKLSLKPQNQALLAWADTLPPNASVLILFDVQAGYADEINLIAQPVLNLVLTPGRKISLISSSPAGVLLAEQLFDEMLEVEGMIVDDLGYVPFGMLMAYGIASPVKEDHSLLGLERDDFDGVLILSDNFEGTAAWIEQFSAKNPDIPLNCLVTAQAGPLLAPYWETGQISGLISGLSDAHRVESVFGESQDAAYRWRAYRYGILIAIVMLVIGATIADEGKNKDEGQGGG